MNAEAKPDASLFAKNEKPREYVVTFRIEGELLQTIMADSQEEARQQASKLLENDEFGLELDDISDIRIGSVHKTGPLFLATRDGRKIQTSYLQAGDLPRDPDERGF